VVCPEREGAAIALFLANPLVLVEAAGMAHNDIAALSLVFLGLMLQVKRPGRRWIAPVMIVAGALIKASALPALAIVLLWMLRSGRVLRQTLKDCALAGLLAAALFALLAIPFVRQLSQLPLLCGFAVTSMSYEISLLPFQLLKRMLMAGAATLGRSLSFGAAKWMVTGGFLAVFTAAAFRWLRRRLSLAEHLEVLALVYALITILFPYWRPWFVLWPLAFTALRPADRWSGLILVYSLLALMTYAVTGSSGINLVGATW
jgi:hypothetical protein